MFARPDFTSCVQCNAVHQRASCRPLGDLTHAQRRQNIAHRQSNGQGPANDAQWRPADVSRRLLWSRPKIELLIPAPRPQINRWFSTLMTKRRRGWGPMGGGWPGAKNTRSSGRSASMNLGQKYHKNAWSVQSNKEDVAHRDVPQYHVHLY